MGDNPVLPERHLRSLEESLLGSKKLGKFKQVPPNCVPQKQSWSATSPAPDLDPSSDSEQEGLVNADSESLQDSIEQKDFNYSQKLFHIADGNLYSIFSPIQGRSYGMKPSFLRKQKYTVQECHSRGRKNTRKGLKFHNFLPSESVTSEKDSGCADAKWKVYSECRLREEHGTKQISISNWSQSVPKTFNKNLAFGKTTAVSNIDSLTPKESMLQLQNHNQDESKAKSVPSLLNGTSDFMSNSFEIDEDQNIVQFNEDSSRVVLQKSLSSHTSKKDSLNLLLNSLSQKSSMQERMTSYDDSDSPSRIVQKHRRKPVQTRRIVPYKKYLSIVEESEGLPLDLSSKFQIEQASSQYSKFVDDALSSPLTSISCLSQDRGNPPKYAKTTKNSFSFSSDISRFSMPKSEEVKEASEPKDASSNQKQSNMAVLYPFCYDNLNQGKQNLLFPPPPPLIGLNSTEMFDAKQRSLNPIAESRFPTEMNLFLPSSQKSAAKEVPPKPRRRNQRSAMKQKLEDSFRQNGFLVKTKQVSDGEATFCKFRQLRKCTRYYLKSLEQHLPDEFHKMLKGFLPPKTVLPPVLGALNSSSET